MGEAEKDSKGEKEEEAQKGTKGEKEDEVEKGSKGEKEDDSEKDSKGDAKGTHELQRLFVADDRIDSAKLTQGSSTSALSRFAAAGAGILLLAGAAMVFRNRRPVDPVVPMLIADEAPD